MSSGNHQKKTYLCIRITNKSSKTAFKCRLRETFWDAVKGLGNPNESFLNFLETIMQIYDEFFPKTNSKIISNNKGNPWITKVAPFFKVDDSAQILVITGQYLYMFSMKFLND